MRKVSISLSLCLCLLAGALMSSPPGASAASRRLECKRVRRPMSEGNDTKRAFRFCSGKVLSYDKTTLLDVDVTLPARGRGPFPLIAMHPGLSGVKDDFQPDTVVGSGGSFRFNNWWFASKGYMVLTYTNRGWERLDDATPVSESACANRRPQSVDAKPDSLYEGAAPSPACYPQIAHIKYEVRDTQFLIGRLVDGTLLDIRPRAKRRKVGATGISYGGGQTWLLTRRNVWRSPKGRRIKLAAAAPLIGWTDIVDALLPNGRQSDEGDAPTLAERKAEPPGVKNRYVDLFFFATMWRSTDAPLIAGYLEEWKEAIDEGEPYDSGPNEALLDDAIHKLLTRRSAQFVPKKTAFDTPILSLQGFTDGIFPGIQTIRMHRKLQARRAAKDRPPYPQRIYLGDWGHPPSQSKASEFRYMAKRINEWFRFYLKRRGPRPPRVWEARTTVCDGPEGQPGVLYRGPTWSSLQNVDNPMTIQWPQSGTLMTPTEDPHDNLLIPADNSQVAGGSNGLDQDNQCRVSGDTSTPEGNYSAANSEDPGGFTMLGLPTVTLEDVDPTRDDMYIAARLWDLDLGADQLLDTEDDSQTLVTRGVYRLGDAGAAPQDISFKLFGNAYTFAMGHLPKLELTADDSPSFRRYGDPGTTATEGSIDFVNPGIEIPRADCDRRLPSPCP